LAATDLHAVPADLDTRAEAAGKLEYFIIALQGFRINAIQLYFAAYRCRGYKKRRLRAVALYCILAAVQPCSAQRVYLAVRPDVRAERAHNIGSHIGIGSALELGRRDY